ncbi:MAG: Sec-independent protein translocase protein TatB [Betaproteobacteria bacterium]|nr:Sec-independent protein translocase protein TatB [Betaproteobacteria bacterium]
MFDIGFSELLVIAVVALIVIGPERLPGVARTVGHLLGRLQRYVADVKADINREIELDELRKMRDSFQEAAAEVESTVRKELTQTEQDLNKTIAAASEPNAAGSQAAPAAVEAGAAHPPEAESPAPHAPPSANKAALPESR